MSGKVPNLTVDTNKPPDSKPAASLTPRQTLQDAANLLIDLLPLIGGSNSLLNMASAQRRSVGPYKVKHDADTLANYPFHNGESNVLVRSLHRFLETVCCCDSRLTSILVRDASVRSRIDRKILLTQSFANSLQGRRFDNSTPCAISKRP